MARLHLIIGPVGAGKSTFAAQLCQQYQTICLNLDDWMALLFRPDRPESDVMAWYLERVERCIKQIAKLATEMVDAGHDVVLEIGLIQRAPRRRFCEDMAARGYDLTMYLLDAPREVRRKRVEQRNHAQGATFSMVVPPEIFELASDMWEPPDEVECRDFDVRAI